MSFNLLNTSNFPDLITHRMKRPGTHFIACDDNRNFTHAEFWSLAGDLATGLAAQGAKPGDRIAVQIEKSIEAIALFYACLRGGFIFLPLNTAYMPSEIDYFLGDAEPSIFMCEPENRDSLTSIATKISARITTLDETKNIYSTPFLRKKHALDDHRTTWTDVAAILYTSGTTGRSKGAMLTQANLASNALALIDCWQFTAEDRLIHALPVHHTHGLFTATNTIFLSGGELLYRRSFDAVDVLKTMPQATAMMGVPTFYTRLLAQSGLTREATKHMRLFISGSAPLLTETHGTFAERTGHAILERYGMTETSMNTSNPYDGERRAGTVGFPLPGVDIRIRKTPDDANGMIEIHGPNVFAGYWRNPEKTREDSSADGWFISGDIGHFDSNGYLVISGRAKDLIISGGFNIYPREIELLLDSLPGVLESAVIGVPHPDFGEAVVAVLATATLNDNDTSNIIRTLKDQIANFKVPKQVIFVPDLPRNAMGKVQKAVLRDKYNASFV
jgi:malonyl-CoA/methylmalonyl-CoA synthetase